jgi:hypothetical protein
MAYPRSSNYQLIETLNIKNGLNDFLPDLEEEVRRRVIQSQVSALKQDASDPGWDHSSTAVQTPLVRWSVHHKPNLKTLKVSSDDNDTLSCVLQL